MKIMGKVIETIYVKTQFWDNATFFQNIISLIFSNSVNEIDKEDCYFRTYMIFYFLCLNKIYKFFFFYAMFLYDRSKKKSQLDVTFRYFVFFYVRNVLC